jgi:uncharacterized protein
VNPPRPFLPERKNRNKRVRRVKVIKPKYPLYLRHSKERGWGVFCEKKIPKGRVFETAPIIYLPAKSFKRTSDTPIESYRFSFWGDSCAIVLGFGSLYNHSEEGANSVHDVNRKSRTYSFRALKDIPAHTEIFHDYNWDPSEYKKRGMKSEKQKEEEREERKKQAERAKKKKEAARKKRHRERQRAAARGKKKTKH